MNSRGGEGSVARISYYTFYDSRFAASRSRIDRKKFDNSIFNGAAFLWAGMFVSLDGVEFVFSFSNFLFINASFYFGYS